MGGNGKCPMCGAATAAKFRPFCSKRCANIDLNRWLVGAYRVPTDESPESEGESGGTGVEEDG